MSAFTALILFLPFFIFPPALSGDRAAACQRTFGASPALSVFARNTGASPVNNQEKGSEKETADRSAPIRVAAGREFTLTLEANPTTGYQWRLAKTPEEAVVKFLGSEYAAPETRLVGAGGKEIWRFIALAPGKATIEMVYARPWEKDSPPARMRSFEITVY